MEIYAYTSIAIMTCQVGGKRVNHSGEVKGRVQIWPPKKHSRHSDLFDLKMLASLGSLPFVP